ncbi:hypothetical protein [Anaerosolibacter sp.]|uniref:hypothetical protein n=1 Tax=Anaerosolibacter sp. TaxID=1872527 RepID=UPI002616A465|nr:hypothetical protein [Anaerosolibacter sp.]
MGFVRYYRDAEGKAYYFKHCKGQSHAFRKHAHEEYSVALVTGGESLFRFVDKCDMGRFFVTVGFNDYKC